MRIPRPFLAAASLTVVIMTASTGVASAAPTERTKGEVKGITVTAGSPLPAGDDYTLSVNASGDGMKSSGGFTLSRPGSFVGGKTTLYCPGAITTIVNEFNPPKKSSPDLTGYYLEIDLAGNDLETATIEIVPGEAPTSCDDVA